MSENASADWLQAVDTRGRTYYYHRTTRETTWQDPYAANRVLQSASVPAQERQQRQQRPSPSLSSPTAPIQERQQRPSPSLPSPSVPIQERQHRASPSLPSSASVSVQERKHRVSPSLPSSGSVPVQERRLRASPSVPAQERQQRPSPSRRLEDFEESQQHSYQPHEDHLAQGSRIVAGLLHRQPPQSLYIRTSHERGRSDSGPSRSNEQKIDEDWYPDAISHKPSRRGSTKQAVGLTVNEPLQASPQRDPVAVASQASRHVRSRSQSSKAMGSVSGETWVECREVVSGRTIFYHSVTKEIIFDERPVPIPLSVKAPVPASISSSTSTAVIPQLPADGPGPAYQYVHRGSIVRSIERSGSSTSLSVSVGTGNKASSSAQASGSLSRQRSGRRKRASTVLIPDSGMRLGSVHDSVNELLDANKLPWNFNNASVRQFRARMNFAGFTQFLPTPLSMAFPRYFSNDPIPTPRLLVCTIKLPDQAAAEHTKINCAASDSADDLLSKALRKYASLAVNSSCCVLKALGSDEYLYGSAQVLDFQYVRSCLRSGVEIRLTLLVLENMQSTIDEVRVEMEGDLLTPCYDQSVLDTETITDEHYEEALCRDTPVDQIRYLPIQAVNVPLRFQIVDLDDIVLCPRFDSTTYAICVEAQLMHGPQQLSKSVFRTRFRRPREGLRYSHEVSMTSSDISSLPRDSVLVLLVYAVKAESKETLLAFVKCPLVGDDSCLVSGQVALPLWMLDEDDKSTFDCFDLARATPLPNRSLKKAPIVYLRFDKYLFPVIWPSLTPPVNVTDAQVGAPVSLSTLSSKIRKRLDEIVKFDSLTELNDADRALLWLTRHNFIDDPSVLPKLLRCVEWENPQKAAEGHRMMYSWARPTNQLEALALLDVMFPDYRVREYAVGILEELSDSDLQQVLLQLVQALKFQVHHDSPLSRFLLRRGISNPYQIGHFLFWHMKAELHNPDYCERFAVLLECYLAHFQRHARELLLQNHVIQELLIIAEKIVRYKSVDKLPAEACKKELRKELTKLNENFPKKWQVSLNPKWQVSGLRPDECKYMSSKKLPLWLSFENADADGSPILVIFKTGDDLRQDMLTLQLFRTMDRTWRKSGQDMQLRPYTCVATGVNSVGEGVGMIEVVLDSNTLSRIQIEEGGGALGALKNGTLVKWLQKFSKGAAYDTAVSNFQVSCAGYCVATFCLGIGDRHNDNIMLTKKGHLFHIDFGHFLGNFKSKYGFKRERAPFVFTPEMAQVMGGIKSRQYKDFVTLCCDIFNLLRKEASIFISIFKLMLSAGMPELQGLEDIFYLRDRLLLDVSDSEASKMFKKEIKSSVGDFYRRVDNTIHNLKHK